MSASDWIRDAGRLPLRFAQVREDPDLDRWVVERVGRAAKVIMVSSGGCTAAALAGWGGVAQLHMVDPNSAQIAIARLKLRMLCSHGPEERLALLGHAPMPPGKRARALAGLLHDLGYTPEILGPTDFVALHGPDQAGRYERVFTAFRAILAPLASEIESLLDLEHPAEQSARVDPSTRLGAAIEHAFGDAMALPNLVALFGEQATRNPRAQFADHFLRQLRWNLAMLPARANPFLTQLLLGRFESGGEHRWLQMAPQAVLPEISYSVSPMLGALRERARYWDVVHLSNILDWLSAAEARETLDASRDALTSGGWVIIRQLNSTLEIRELGNRFEWLADESNALLARDRSFFYSELHIGRRL